MATEGRAPRLAEQSVRHRDLPAAVAVYPRGVSFQARGEVSKNLLGTREREPSFDGEAFHAKRDARQRGCDEQIIVRHSVIPYTDGRGSSHGAHKRQVPGGETPTCVNPAQRTADSAYPVLGSKDGPPQPQSPHATH
jgi:hypothetical protein